MAVAVPFHYFTTRAASSAATAMVQIRKGQAPRKLDRQEFHRRFFQNFQDPAFRAEDESLLRVEEVAWEAYREGRKAPVTVKAGPGYADPDYELSVDWIEARDRIRAAQARFGDPAGRSRTLVICGSSRNDGTCPGEISKSFRMSQRIEQQLKSQGIDVDMLDLSELTSTYGRHIHPCKGCVSTAMPLCHFPCSCYPNHSLNQVGDWMNEIYERWTAAHAIIIVTPVYWYQSPGPLKLMIDRLVCADGGNPDPTSTHGKTPEEAKQLELDGWSYPKHLAGRVFGVVVHGDVAGIEGSRRALSDWLSWMGLIDAGRKSMLDRYIGYYESYALSHETYDRDEAVQKEVDVVALSVAEAVKDLRAGRLSMPGSDLKDPRPK